MILENPDFNEIVEKQSFNEFTKTYFLLDIGYDLCISANRYAKVYTFRKYLDRTDCVKVYSFLPVSAGFMCILGNTFRVEKRKSGDYVIATPLDIKEVTDFSVDIFEKEKEEYHEAYWERRRKEEEDKRRKEIQVLREKRNRFLYDFSGDDSSLNSNMW